MSHFLTEKVAKRAVEMILPAVRALVADDTLKRGDFHIVVATRPSFMHWSSIDEMERAFQQSIVYEYSHTEPSGWEFPFDAIARDKCILSWEHGLSTLEIQTQHPHLLRKGNTTYYGSVVRNGIVFACSGVQPFFDHMISGWGLDATEALCLQARGELKPDDNGFIV